MERHFRERIAPEAGALTFTVEGRGAFPVDMLRFDHCYPYTESQDSYSIAMTRDDAGYSQLRRVVLQVRPLAGERWVNLTPARWASFNWTFIGVGEQRVAQPSDDMRTLIERGFDGKNGEGSF